MKWTLPGTVLPGDPALPEQAEDMFSSWFLTGGLVLSQVAQITGLEAYTVQNWVKRGFLSPPVKKKYSQDQLSRIIVINMLKSVLPMEDICGLLSSINGRLDDEGDDTINDSRLYFSFLHLAGKACLSGYGQIPTPEEIRGELADYREENPGDLDKIVQVISIMLTAWQSARLKRQAETMLAGLQHHTAGEKKEA